MSDAAAMQQATSFESASEFRDAHARLLETLDEALGRDATAEGEAAALARIEPQVLEFLRRGEATGVFIEEMKERTACQVLLDYWASSLSQAGRAARSVRLARFDAQQLPDLKDKTCPYMGLEAFRDPTYFFGRDGDTQALLDQLRQSPLLVVLGASGSGKSSLVMGGLLPAAAADAQLGNLCVVPAFVPGNRALTHLARAVRQSACGAGAAADGGALRENPGRLSEMLGGSAARPTLITIDQFEEVFTLLDEAEREALVANLAQLLGSGRGHRVVLTVREEFRSRIVGLSALGPHLDTAWYSMRPMGYAELRAAVEKPAAMVNLQFQSGIVDDLVKKVLGQPAALPLLQFTLHELWEKRDRNRITFEVYRKVGDPLNALTAAANAFYDGLALQTQNEVRRILLELVRVDELLEAYRQPVPMSRLLMAGSASTEAVLGLLAANDYVRIAATAGDTDPVVEVKHESLVRNWPRFVAWIDEKRHQRRERLALTQAAERWAKSGKPQDGLLTGWQLEAAGSATDLMEVEKEFVQASMDAIDRVLREKEEALRREAAESRATARRFRNFSIATGILSIATIVLAAIAIYASVSASRVEKANREKVLLAMKLQPLKYVDDQLDLALLLGIEANRIMENQPELRQALWHSLGANLDLVSLFAGHKDIVRAVAISADGRTIASGSYDKAVILWDASGQMLHAPLKGHTKDVIRVAFSPDGKLLASASTDRTVRLWDVSAGKPIDQLPHPDEVYCVAIAKDGKTLASSGKDGKIWLWNIEARKVEHAFVHNVNEAGTTSGRVYSIAFSPDGKLIASGGMDGRMVLWDVQGRKQVRAFEVKDRRGIWSVAFSHDGRTIASGTSDGYTDLWDLAQPKVSRRLGTKHFGTGVIGMAFSKDDQKLATVGTDRNAYVHSLADPNARPKRLTGYAQPFYSVDFSGNDTIVTGAGNAMIAVWNPAGLHRFGKYLVQQESPTPLAFGADRNSLVTFKGEQLHFWGLASDSRPRASRVDAKQGRLAFLLSAPKSDLLASVGANGSVKLWNITERRELKALVKPGKEKVFSAALSADGRTLALGFARDIRVWNVEDGSLAHTLQYRQPGKIVALAFDPVRRRLASAMEESGITLWDLDSLDPAVEAVYGPDPRLDHQRVNTLAYSPDGQALISGGWDSVGFWDADSGKPMGRLASYHPGDILAVAVSPDGSLLASASSDRTVLLWDLRTRQPMGKPITAHRSRALSVAFSPDGRWLASSDQDGAVIRWETDVEAWVSGACGIVGRNFTDDEWKQFFGDQPPRVSCPRVKAYEADALALAGDRAGAEESFKEAVHAVLETRDHRAGNSVCWFGSVHRYAKLVLPACDRAVELAPDDVAKTQYLDSRGLARALAGNTAGAIDDFATAVEFMRQFPDFRPAQTQLRESWISALRNGLDPFDDATLRALRTE